MAFKRLGLVVAHLERRTDAPLPLPGQDGCVCVLTRTRAGPRHITYVRTCAHLTRDASHAALTGLVHACSEASSISPRHVTASVLEAGLLASPSKASVYGCD
eukprot:1946535-Rhodomonas_salina.2